MARVLKRHFIGSKGYSCCSRRVLEFDEFLKIAPCKEATHLFIGRTAVTSPVASAPQQIRHDFYQTQTSVILSYYAPKCDKTRSAIHFETDQVGSCSPCPCRNSKLK